MLVGRCLYEVIALLARFALADISVVGPRIFHTPVTPPALHLVTDTLALTRQLVAVHGLGAPGVAVAGGAAGGREAVVVCHADVAPVTRHSGPAVTPPRSQVTGLAEGAERVTVTRVTASATVDVPVSVPAPPALLTLHVVLAAALPGGGVTQSLASLRVWPGASLVTLAGPAALAPVKGGAPVTCSAHLAPPACSVVLTLQTLASDGVTVPSVLEVNVAVTLTLQTRSWLTVDALRVPVVTVHTLLTPGPRPPRRTLRTHRCAARQVAPASPGGSVLRGDLGAGTELTVVRSGSPGVSVVAVSADVAGVPGGVVCAVTHSGLHVAVVAVAVAVAGYTAARGLVIISLLAGLAVLTSIPHRAGALLHPQSGSSARAGQSSLQPHAVNKSLAWSEVGASDLDGCQVGEERHELQWRELRPPAEAAVLVEDQLVTLQLLTGQRIALGRDEICDAQLLAGDSSSYNHVLGRILNPNRY